MTNYEQLVEEIREEINNYDLASDKEDQFYKSPQLHNLYLLKKDVLDLCGICERNPIFDSTSVCEDCYIYAVEYNDFLFDQYFEQKDKIKELEERISNFGNDAIT